MAGPETPVVVLARIVAQPGNEDAVREALISLVSSTRQEAGNISYELVQNAVDTTEFVTVERWKDASYLPVHMQQPHVGAAIAKVGSLLAAPPAIVTYNEIPVPN